MTSSDNVFQNKQIVEQSKYLTGVKISIRLFSRNTYINYARYNIITCNDKSVILHDGYQGKEISLSDNICPENTLTITTLIKNLLDKHFSSHKIDNQKLDIEFFVASEQKPNTYKYSFELREIITKEAMRLRKL